MDRRKTELSTMLVDLSKTDKTTHKQNQLTNINVDQEQIILTTERYPNKGRLYLLDLYQRITNKDVVSNTRSLTQHILQLESLRLGLHPISERIASAGYFEAMSRHFRLLDLDMAVDGPESLILFADDSAEAHYRDGTRVRLSPCGSEFVYERTEAAAHPLQGPDRKRHRTEYVTSSYRDRVLQLLQFRNTFSSRPFLPSSLVPQEQIISHLTEISEVTWPSLDDAEGCLTYLKDGSVKVSSLDGNAHLYMPAMKDGFTVEFLCQLSIKVTAPVPKTHRPKDDMNIKIQNGHTAKVTHGSNISGTAENTGTCNADIIRSKYTSYPFQLRDEALSFTNHAFQYTWQIQSFSVLSCPEAFTFPMALALRFHQKPTEYDENSDPPTDVEIAAEAFLKEHENGIVSVLPKSLPLSCRGTHLHSWNFCELPSEKQDVTSTLYPLPFKVVIHSNITYRFIFYGSNTVEIHPGDGSVFISDGINLGKYFKYSFKGETGKKEKRIYTMRDLPPDKPRSLYSVRSLISRAVRYLEICCRNKLSLNPLSDICCWNLGSTPGAIPAVPALLEQSDIPGIGRFAAYSDNMVLATFLDGVILHMIWNFTFHKDKRDQNKENPFLPKGYSAPKPDGFGYCRLYFPNGATKLVQLEWPGNYARYIRSAKDWCRSLEEKTQRETPKLDSEENWSVTAELQKIHRFQFLLENSRAVNHRSDINLSKQPDPDQTSPHSDMNIESILAKTSRAIQDIELLLSSRK
ncbi:uncharacterized protein C5orf34 homolog [Discoglossus pictus]